MSEIKINKITETTCDLYDPDDNLIGEIKSYLELADVRIQIMKKKVIGYYVLWNWKEEDDEVRYPLYISEKGRLDEWPVGFFDEYDKQLDELLNFYS